MIYLFSRFDVTGNFRSYSLLGFFISDLSYLGFGYLINEKCGIKMQRFFNSYVSIMPQFLILTPLLGEPGVTAVMFSMGRIALNRLRQKSV